jgi:hypothetical protein
MNSSTAAKASLSISISTSCPTHNPSRGRRPGWSSTCSEAAEWTEEDADLARDTIENSYELEDAMMDVVSSENYEPTLETVTKDLSTQHDQAHALL